MKILYICDFNLNRHIGKDRATRQKLTALAEHCDSLIIISAKSTKQYLRIFESFWIEIKSIFIILKTKPDYIISRGYVGWLFQLIAKIIGIKTAREIHSDIQGEAKLIPYKGFRLIMIRLMTQLNVFSDKIAFVRIFNHPDLMKWYQANHKKGNYDFYSYNGYDPKSKSNLNLDDALKKFNLSQDIIYLVFIGGASKWHGIEYLISLQEEFNTHNDHIQIICGGGDISSYDKNKVCLNFTPLNSEECTDLIKAATLCLLPVKNNRTSPGSPLKLYDYICNEKYIIAAEKTNGYHDEITKFNIGIGVNFENPTETRKSILNFIKNTKKNDFIYPECPVKWSDRMQVWIKNLSKTLN